MKQLVAFDLDRTLDGLLSGWEYPVMEAMLASPDAVEWPLAFAEKRASCGRDAEAGSNGLRNPGTSLR